MILATVFLIIGALGAGALLAIFWKHARAGQHDQAILAGLGACVCFAIAGVSIVSMVHT